MEMKKWKLFIILPVSLMLALALCLISGGGNIEASPVFDSSKFEKKIKTAIVGDGVIEITQSEASAIASCSLKGKGIEKAAVNFNGNNVKLQALLYRSGMKIYINTMMYPYMADDNINIKVEKLYIGRIPISTGFALYLLKSYLPDGFKILPGAVLNIGDGIGKIKVKNVYIKNGNFYIVLNEDTPDNNVQADKSASSSRSGENAASSKGTVPVQKNSAPSKPGTGSAADLKAEALKETNSELYGVYSDVPSPAGRDWVTKVISVNKMMMDSPEGNYSSQINSTKKEYSALPINVKDEIKKAALQNLDIEAVKLLIISYGI